MSQVSRITSEDVLRDLAVWLAFVDVDLREAASKHDWYFDGFAQGSTRHQIVRCKLFKFIEDYHELEAPGRGMHVRVVVEGRHYVIVGVHWTHGTPHSPALAQTWGTKSWLWPSDENSRQMSLFPADLSEEWGSAARPLALCWASDMVFVGIPDRVTSGQAAIGFSTHHMLWRSEKPFLDMGDFETSEVEDSDLGDDGFSNRQEEVPDNGTESRSSRGQASQGPPEPEEAFRAPVVPPVKPVPRK